MQGSVDSEVGKSPVKRTKRRGLLRNVATALSQSDSPEVKDTLKNALECETEPLMWEAIEWALKQATTELSRG